MKIILDPQIYNSQQYGGISKYYTEIFARLLKSEDAKINIPLNNASNIHFNNSGLNLFKHKLFFYFLRILKKVKLDKKLKIDSVRNFFLTKLLNKGNYDLFVPTYYNTEFLSHIKSKPFVLTVHDMIYELFPEYFANNTILVKNKLLLMEKAKRIIAISENTKKDILKIYPHIDSHKIDVVYHGVSIKIKNLEISLPENFILFVGTRSYYKNFYYLISSISEFLKKESNLYLICAGGGLFTAEENEYIQRLDLGDKIIQKDFNEDELGLFYKNAKCFVFPSAYEGFGIPVLEAMACGCPVVLGNHSSFPEIAGDAGVYFEMNNPEDLLNKITSLIQNEFLRNAFSQKGIEQAKKFNWDKAAKECLEVYRKAVEM